MATPKQEKNDNYYRSKIYAVLAKGSLRKAKSLLKEVNAKIGSNSCSPWFDGDQAVKQLRLFIMTNGKGLPVSRNTSASSSRSGKSTEEESGGFRVHWTIKLLILILTILYIIGSD